MGSPFGRGRSMCSDRACASIEVSSVLFCACVQDTGTQVSRRVWLFFYFVESLAKPCAIRQKLAASWFCSAARPRRAAPAVGPRRHGALTVCGAPLSAFCGVSHSSASKNICPTPRPASATSKLAPLTTAQLSAPSSIRGCPMSTRPGPKRGLASSLRVHES